MYKKGCFGSNSKSKWNIWDPLLPSYLIQKCKWQDSRFMITYKMSFTWCANCCYNIFLTSLFDNIARCNPVSRGLKNLIDKSIDDNASSALYRWIRRKGLLPGVFISAISQCVNLRFYISQNECIQRNLIVLL